MIRRIFNINSYPCWFRRLVVPGWNGHCIDDTKHWQEGVYCIDCGKKVE